MRLPHITIEYREDDFGIGRLSTALILGFGVHWAWVYLAMFNGGALFGIPMQLRPVMFGVSLSAFCLTFFAYVVFLTRARELFATPPDRRRNRRVAAGVAAAGTLLFFAGAWGGLFGVVCALLAALMTGFGSAVLLMSYGVSFSVCDVANAAASLALSLVPATLVFVAMLLLDGVAHPAGAIACALLPLVELACLTITSRQLVDNLEFQAITMPVRLASFAPRLGLPCFVFGIILGVVRSQAALGPQTADYTTDVVGAIALAGVAACVLVLLATIAQRQTPNYVFRTLLPVFALLMALAAAPMGHSPWMGTLLLFLGYLLLESCLWIMLADVSQRHRISAFLTFGIGRGAMGLGTLVSSLLLLGGPAAEALNSMQSLTAIAFVLVTLGYSMLPKPGEIARCLARGGGHAPEFDDEVGLAAIAGGDAPVRRAEDAGVDGANDAARAPFAATLPHAGASGDADPADGRRRDLAAAGVGGVRGSAPSSASSAGETPEQAEAENLTDLDAQHAAGGRADDASPAAPSFSSGADPSHRPGSQGGVTPGSPAARLVPAAVASPFDPTPTEDQQRLGRFKRKCAAVADTYLLSRKETEVLFLLAKGHNAAAIQEALFISAGTANTHMRHIYRKLDVHSQQDLIRLVESTDVG